jgi:phosphoribosylformimino-5-aminoimidazole carboxamide ribotide isomerase
MIIFPAIDIRGGKCVRLLKGNFNNITHYKESPIDQAIKFEELGFSHLHIVDLDRAAASQENNSNLNIIKNIIKNTNIKIQLGGGLRTLEHIDEVLGLGVDSVVLGTLAINNISLLNKICNKFPNQVAVGVDTKNGLIATHGWTQITKTLITDYLKKIKDIKIKRIIFTDIERDGTKKGINLAETLNLTHITKFPVVASGGVSKIEDITEIINTKVIEGVIIGKAIYDGDIDIIKLSKII